MGKEHSSTSKGEIANAYHRIEVTESDIEKAHKGDSYKCVVAQSIARTLKDATRIEVDTQCIRFTRRDARYIYNTPPAVQGYVVAFDAGESVEPFSFQLRHARRIQRRLHTTVGRTAMKAVNRVRRKLRKNNAPDGTVKESVKAAYASAVKGADEAVKQADVPPSFDVRPSPPRVFKTKSRSYGHRLLRINQKEAV